MALLHRLFSSRRKQQPQKGYGVLVSSESKSQQFDFSKEQVRIVLFRECERRGQKLLFDSRAVKKIPLLSILQCSKLRKGVKAEDIKKSEAFVEITNGFGYQYTRPSPDIKQLGEMVFGSVAMSLRGCTFKVHTGGSPPVFMLTKVSNSPSKRESDRGLEDSHGSSINSMHDYLTSGTSSSEPKLSASEGSCPLDVPLSSSLNAGTSQLTTSNDGGGHLGSLEVDSGCLTNSESSISGFQWNGSHNAVLASPDSRKGSGGSLSSLRRRWLRTASTSLDLDSSQSLNQADLQASCCSLPTSCDDKPIRRPKLGITIIISLNKHQKESMQHFFLEHAALMEGMAVRLHAAVERAYCRKDLFVSMMFDATCDIEQSIEDLVTGPRLGSPVWLGLLSSPTYHTALVGGFFEELCLMLELFDTKETNFFMSTLVTAVLTHHLGWVPTVTPGLRLCLRQDGNLSSFKLSDLPKTHPYNPLWAQAMDLYGALGNPLRSARTIIMSLSGSKGRIETIERLLRIISYFIRCAAIERTEPKTEDILPSINLLSLISKAEDGNSLSVENRSSSSTLCPLAGKCSPLPSKSHTSPQGNCSEISNASLRKQRFLCTVNNVSSKSENNLQSKEANSHVPVKLPASRGLRRTMSYSSRLTSSGVVDGCLKRKPSISDCNYPDGSLSKQLQDRVLMNPVGSASPSSNVDAQDHCSVEKVIFVLGDSENLEDSQDKRKQESDDSDFTQTTFEIKGKCQEQPLSFSGSEVESGFSECESFELSPARSGTVIPTNGKIGHPGAGVNLSNESNLCSKNNKNAERFGTKVKNCLLEDNTIPLHCKSCKVSALQPRFIQNENECEQVPLNTENLRSLARSLSVNLPVCLKSINLEFCLNDFCVSCGNPIIDVDRKESVQPTKEVKQLSNRKTARRLRRAHSSFCVPSQGRQAAKSDPMCQDCNIEKENLPISIQNSPTRVKKDMSHSKSTLCQDLHLNSRRVIELPLPESKHSDPVCETGIARSLFGGVSPHYIAERVLQGCAPLEQGWEVTLKRDLALEALHPTLDPSLSEAVAIVANVDLCEVQLISSHTYVVDRPGTLGVQAGLSQLVANMLESVYHMWKLHAPSDLCLSFLESRLQEVLLRSQALAEFLLTTEFCDMESLTSSLSLEPNDVPLLLAVASTHSPEVTQRYGLSFR